VLLCLAAVAAAQDGGAQVAPAELLNEECRGTTLDGLDACYAGSPFGDGSDASYTVTANTTFVRNVEFVNLTIQPGVRLNTGGHVIRVCGTLTNLGTITDLASGGAGGSGGGGGNGGTKGYLNPPDDGGDGQAGEPAASGVGDGGSGGGGGGGGGAAWNTRALCASYYSDGGDGGHGGQGGTGGGHVVIHAYHLTNQGLIHAKGENGQPGQGGGIGAYLDYGCGIPHADYDHASGSGGGGAGGRGGHGGTVELYYYDQASVFGPIRTYNCTGAAPGLEACGGAGGAAGEAGCHGADCPCEDLYRPAGVSQAYQEGALGGSPGGGQGAEADCGTICGPMQAADGSGGSAGGAGVVLVTWESLTPVTGPTDVLQYDLDLEICDSDGDGSIADDQFIRGTNVMSVRSKDPAGVTVFDFLLSRSDFGNAQFRCWVTPGAPDGTCPGPADPWAPGDETVCTWDSLQDEWTVTAQLDGLYTNGETFCLRVDYAGTPTGHGLGPSIRFDSDESTQYADTDLVATASMPFWSASWWPVKDGAPLTPGDNCDKAEVKMAITVPEGLEAISNGLLTEDGPGASPGTWRYAWSSQYQAAPYVIFFSVAGYERPTDNYHNYYRYTSPEYGLDFPLDFYFYPGHFRTAGVFDQAKLNSFCHLMYDLTVSFLDYFNDLYGPYPFASERFGMYECNLEGAGAIEHQTIPGYAWKAISKRSRPYGDNFVLTPHPIVHEAVHMWMGDLVTPATWNDIWLADGFAEYGVCLWEDSLDPESSEFPDDEYARPLGECMHEYHDLWRKCRFLAPGQQDQVWVEDWEIALAEPWSDKAIFDYATSYLKAAWVHHMLRYVLGTDDYLAGLTEYRAAYENDCATTADWQNVCEDQYGGTLQWFFDEWVYDRGAPRYRYWFWQRLAWWNDPDVSLGVLQIPMVQVFTMPIDVRADIDGGGSQDLGAIWNDQVFEEYVLDVSPAAHVVDVELDPDDWILKLVASRILELLTDLGTLGGLESRGYAINGRGQAVGAADIAAAPSVGHAFLWLPDGDLGLAAGMHDLGVTGTAASVGYDINDFGHIAGQLDEPGVGSHPFLWLSRADYGLEAGLHVLSTPGSAGAALGLNHPGHLVGYVGAEGSHAAALWQYDEELDQWSLTLLDTLGDGESEALAVNDRGEIAGWYTLAGERYGFVWNAQDGMVSLGVGEVFDLNNEGLVVGGLGQQGLAFEFIEGSGWVSHPLATRRSTSTVAYGVNDLGEIVGESEGHAVYWENADADMLDLNDILPPGTGWTLTSAQAINDAGQIVGCGQVDTAGVGTLHERAFVVDLYARMLGGCCLPEGECVRTTAADCTNHSGSYQGDGTSCTALSACCLSDGSCALLAPACCEFVNGEPSTWSTTCLGDPDGNGIDEACEPCPQAAHFIPYPPDGVTDATQPHSISSTTPCTGIGQPGGWVPITVDLGVSGAEDLLCWALCETGYSPQCGPNQITSVVEGPLGVYTINLAHGISAYDLGAPAPAKGVGYVTTIRYNGGDHVTYYKHPSNVDGSSVANVQDINQMIQRLNIALGGEFVPPWECDINQSGAITVADLAALINLLTGAGLYDEWFDTPKPTSAGCP